MAHSLLLNMLNNNFYFQLFANLEPKEVQYDEIRRYKQEYGSVK
jgi:hypothetical protein